MTLDDAAANLEALGNPTRLAIFRTLVRAGLDGMPVGALQQKLTVAPSTLSHHLHQLVAMNLVTQHRHGTTLICRAEFSAMAALVDYLSAECCADAPLPARRRK
ncbi:MAG: metalloregulator ArsR/SmtB family transcription factor [Devosia sp.]